MFFLMQNNFIVPAMQHGCRARPLYESVQKPEYLESCKQMDRKKLCCTFRSVLSRVQADICSRGFVSLYIPHEFFDQFHT